MESLAPISGQKNNQIVFPLSDYIETHPNPYERCFDNFVTWFNGSWKQATIIKASGMWESGHHNYWDIGGVKYMQFSIEDVMDALPSLDLFDGADVVALRDIPMMTHAQEFQFYLLMANLEKRGGIYLIECWDDDIFNEFYQIWARHKQLKSRLGSQKSPMQVFSFVGNRLEIAPGERWAVLDFTGTISFDTPDGEKDYPMPSIKVCAETGSYSRKHDIDYKSALLPEKAPPEPKPLEKEEVDSIVRNPLREVKIEEKQQVLEEDYLSDDFDRRPLKPLLVPGHFPIHPYPAFRDIPNTARDEKPDRRLEFLVALLILAYGIVVLIAGVWPELHYWMG